MKPAVPILMVSCLWFPSLTHLYTSPLSGLVPVSTPSIPFIKYAQTFLMLTHAAVIGCLWTCDYTTYSLWSIHYNLLIKRLSTIEVKLESSRNAVTEQHRAL